MSAYWRCGTEVGETSPILNQRLECGVVSYVYPKLSGFPVIYISPQPSLSSTTRLIAGGPGPPAHWSTQHLEQVVKMY